MKNDPKKAQKPTKKPLEVRSVPVKRVPDEKLEDVNGGLCGVRHVIPF